MAGVEGGTTPECGMKYDTLIIFVSKVFSKSEEMAYQAVWVFIGVFVFSTCVKGLFQPQARVYLTFDGKKVDKHSEENVI